MPNRVLRDYTQSETVDQISAGAEVFFIRLMMKADDFGRFHGDERTLRSFLYPLKEIKADQVRKWLDECATTKAPDGSARPLIIRYEVEGKKYVEIVNFGQHKRAMYSKFPDPLGFESNVQDDLPAEKPKRPKSAKRDPMPQPLLQEFLDFAKDVCAETHDSPAFRLNFESLKFAITSKYHDWAERGWHNGHGKPILNWKTALRNVLPHLRAIDGQQPANNNDQPVMAKLNLNKEDGKK